MDLKLENGKILNGISCFFLQSTIQVKLHI